MQHTLRNSPITALSPSTTSVPGPSRYADLGGEGGRLCNSYPFVLSPPAPSDTPTLRATLQRWSRIGTPRLPWLQATPQRCNSSSSSKPRSGGEG